MHEREIVLESLQPGAVLLPLGEELNPVQDLYAAHIISGIMAFSKQGGLLQEQQSQEAFGAVCFMTEKPDYFTFYPYTYHREAAEKILVVVDPNLRLMPQDFAKNITTNALKDRSYLFPEQGQVLDGNGLTSTLPVGLELAKLVKDNLDRAHYELDWSPADIVRKIRQARAARQISSALNLRDLPVTKSQSRPQTKVIQRKSLAEVLAACPTDMQRGDLWLRTSRRQQKKYLSNLAKSDDTGRVTAEFIKLRCEGLLPRASENDARQWIVKDMLGKALRGTVVVAERQR